MGDSGVPTYSDVCNKTPMCATNSDFLTGFLTKITRFDLLLIHINSVILTSHNGHNCQLTLLGRCLLKSYAYFKGLSIYYVVELGREGPTEIYYVSTTIGRVG